MSPRTVGAAAAAAVLALALVPVADSPLRRLAGGEGDGPDPRFDVPLQGISQLRRYGGTGSHGAYFVDARFATPLVQGNVKAAGQLYLARDLPVQDPAGADFLVRVRGLRIELDTTP